MKHSGRSFRAIPFYELSIEEWVIYEKGQPKYLIDFNRRNKPLVRDLREKLEHGENLEMLVEKLGIFLGRKWTTEHNIKGNEIRNSEQSEMVDLILLDDFCDLFVDLTLVATDQIDMELLLDEDKFFKSYFIEDKNGFLGFESSSVDNDNLNHLMTFLFQKKVQLKEIGQNEDKQVFDLTIYKQSCITTSQLEKDYPEWIKISGLENSMTQYGILIGIIGYINRNIDKQYLLIIIEKRKQFV